MWFVLLSGYEILFLFADSRWISGAGGLLLGSDLTQADIQAEYSCLALDFPSPPLKLTTDGQYDKHFGNKAFTNNI